MQLEKGMNRYKDWQIQEDLTNQELTRQMLEHWLKIDVLPQDEMSILDWEFIANNYFLGFGEYRRRFNNFDVYDDFQFTKKKFYSLKEKALKEKVPAFMFVQFNDEFLYFTIDGEPKTQIMRRNHEIRKEECVCIPKNWFKKLNNLEKELIF
jgi:hypothetical protein